MAACNKYIEIFFLFWFVRAKLDVFVCILTLLPFITNNKVLLNNSVLLVFISLYVWHWHNSPSTRSMQKTKDRKDKAKQTLKTANDSFFVLNLSIVSIDIHAHAGIRVLGLHHSGRLLCN